jgi:ParB family transcriptional regulator, chromosome partitioning protein
MKALNNICPISERRYEEVPIDKVKVINSRNRDKEQFDMNVESIESVGLLKPIRVNDKFLEATDEYELICGEGRLLAHKKLGKTHVMAEVVTCTRKESLLQSLIENIARTKPGSMDFARELKRLHDEGLDFKQIAKIACKSDEYVRSYIRLVEQGEERLIQGVESGIFPVNFAMQVASTEDSQIQGVLMDAFAEGLVTTSNFGQARRIIAARAKTSKKSKASRDYTVNQLQHDIAETTKVKTSYVREAKSKENRFMTLLAGVNALFQDERMLDLLRIQKLDKRPELAGNFRFEQTTDVEVRS